MLDVSGAGSKNLFICCTPFQGMLAERIILEKGLPRENCVLFFYSSFDNEKYRYAYEQLRARCLHALFYVWKADFPRYILDAKRYFRTHDWDAVYAASIDSVFVQMALSSKRRKQLFTFDDGAANIVRSGHYHREVGHTMLRKLAFWLLGNRYNSSRVKREAQLHYTVYRGVPNIVPRVQYVSLFDSEEEHAPKRGQCTVVIGTVLREIAAPDKRVAISRNVVRHINDIQGDVFYLLHPRDMDAQTGKAQIIQTKELAEAVIARLMQSYESLNLLGFGSSVQLNVAASARIRNQFFTWPGEPFWMKEVRHIEQTISGRAATLISIV